MNGVSETLNSAAEAWWPWTVSAFWQSAIVGLLLLVLVALGRRWSSPIRYGLLLIALIKFAIPPLWAAPTGLLSQIGPVHRAEEVVTPEPTPVQQPIARFPDAGVLPQEPASPTKASSNEPSERPHPLDVLPVEPRHEMDRMPNTSEHRFGDALANTPAPVAHPAAPLTWKTYLLLAHLLGAIAVVVIVIRQLLVLQQLVRAARPADEPTQQVALALQTQLSMRRAVRILRSSRADSPIAFGTVRPTIILPPKSDEVSADDLKTVLGHELAHLRRGDGWIGWLQLALMAAWWFHPVFWLVNRTLRRVREDCCDDLLIASGLTTQDAYCDTLLRVAARPSTAPVHVACSMAGRLHPLANRLKRIMDPRVRRAVRLSVVNLVLIVLAAGVLLPGLRTQPTQAQEGKTDELLGQKFEIPEGLPVLKPKVDPFGYRNQRIEFEPFEMSGRCIDSAGKPVVGAEIRLLASALGPLPYVDEAGNKKTVGPVVATARSDATGRYEFNLDRFPVRHFKPDPVEKPNEASFLLLATADKYSLAWRDEKIVRHCARPEKLDPVEQAKLFFNDEPVELDLTFYPEVIIHGIVSDDLGQPIEGATVQLGIISGDRSLPGQEPRTMSYSFTKASKRKSEISPGFGLRTLPEAFRIATTDSQGRYRIRGMPADARAAIFAAYKPEYAAVRNSVVTSPNDKTRRFERYVGKDGKLNLTLTRPRSVAVKITSAEGTVPRCIVRARSTNRRAPYLRGGAMAESKDGVASLLLPPGEFDLVIEPVPGQLLVSSTHKFEVKKEPLDQAVEFKVAHGADVAIRAVVKGTNEPLSGVGFSWQAEPGVEPIPLQSQTVFVDHPRTDSNGILRATMRPGRRRLIPTTIPPGYAPVEKETAPLNFEAGTRTIVRVEFEGAALKANSGEVSQQLRDLIDKFSQQQKLVSRGRYTYRRRSFLRGEMLPAEFDQVLETIDDKSPAHAEAVLKHVFPQLKLSHQSVMLVDGNKLAVGRGWSDGVWPWQGIRVTDLSVQNGVEQARYSAVNHQLDLNTARNSNVHIGAFSEIVTVGTFGRLEPGLEMTEDEGLAVITVPGGRMVADKSTGFMYEMKSMRPNGSGLVVRQYSPVEHANGGVTPSFRIEARFRNNLLDRAEIAFIDKAELVDRFPPGTFVIAAPAGTNIIDRRDARSNRIRQGERYVVTRAPILDAVARANELRPQKKAVAEATPDSRRGLSIGDPAPAFDVAGWYDQNGKTKAPNFENKTVIAFFHSYEPNKYGDENRTLREAMKVFEGRAVLFVNVYSHKTDAKQAQRFMKQFNLPWKFAIDKPRDDDKRRAGKTFRAFEIPHPTTTIIIGSAGQLSGVITHTEQAADAIRRVNRLAPPAASSDK